MGKKHKRLKRRKADLEAEEREAHKESEKRRARIKELWNLIASVRLLPEGEQSEETPKDLNSQVQELFAEQAPELVPWPGQQAALPHRVREENHKSRITKESLIELNVLQYELVALQKKEIEYLTKFRDELEGIREFDPEQLKWLSNESASARASAAMERIYSLVKKSPPKGSAKRVWDRIHRKRNWFESIEYQFGGAGEADWGKPQGPPLWLQNFIGGQALAPLFSGPPPYQPRCLDGILNGEVERLNTQKLQSLFYGIPRDRLLEILKVKGLKGHREGRGFVYSWRAVLMIMKTLLNEEPKKRQWAGGKARRIWLSDPELRTRVLTGIEARINTLSVPQDIRSAFLDVIHAHLT
jgi:hypothetical protein